MIYLSPALLSVVPLHEAAALSPANGDYVIMQKDNVKLQGLFKGRICLILEWSDNHSLFEWGFRTFTQTVEFELHFSPGLLWWDFLPLQNLSRLQSVKDLQHAHSCQKPSYTQDIFVCRIWSCNMLQCENIPKALNISVLINSFFSLLFSNNKDLFLEPFLFWSTQKANMCLHLGFLVRSSLQESTWISELSTQCTTWCIFFPLLFYSS